MQPDLGVGNLSVISGAKRRDSEAPMCIRVIGFARSL